MCGCSTSTGTGCPTSHRRSSQDYYVRPDFTYHARAGDVAIFIDGPVHDSEHQAEKDHRARTKLEDEAGWMVLRFHHEDNRTDGCGEHPSWISVIKANPSIFGPGKDAP